MILADATFIVAAMLGFYNRDEFSDGYECLCRRTYTGLHVKRDLALLENQVPLFILIDLYEIIRRSRNGLEWSFCKLAICFFKFITISPTEIPDDYVMMGRSPEDSEEETEVRHLVDLLRRYRRPSKSRMNPRGNESSHIAFHSLTELYECGVKLKLSTSKDALDIRYINGTLEIPKIGTSPRRMATLENMVSFEQCYCKEERYMTDYVSLLSNLMRSANDVELLIRLGVIDGWFNQDICKWFYDLGKEAIFYRNQYYYKSLCEDLDAYCKKPWHTWRATLRHEYSKNPFAAVSAFLSFLMTLLELFNSGDRWGTTVATFAFGWGPPSIFLFLILAYLLNEYYPSTNPLVVRTLFFSLTLPWSWLAPTVDIETLATTFTTVFLCFVLYAFLYA